MRYLFSPHLLSFALPICMIVLAPGAVRSQWFDDFDSYAKGSTIAGKGGWTGWDNAAGVDADIVDEQASSAPNSLRLRTGLDSDMVQMFQDFTGGVWKMRAMTFIPADHVGYSYFILLNTYVSGGAKDWSTQVVFANGWVASVGGSNFGGTGSVPWIVDEWVPLEVDIDLDANVQVIWYGGKKVDEIPWQLSGVDSIAAIDLYNDISDGTYPAASAIYFDDLSLTMEEIGPRPQRTLTLSGECPSPNPTSVKVVQPLAGGANPQEVVTVTETVRGRLAAAQVTAANGGVVSDIFPPPVTSEGYITAWLLLGPFSGHTGADNPTCQVMAMDYLTDGATTEFNILPEPGQTISTDFGASAASIAILGPAYLNPDGVPTWNAHYNDNDTIDFNAEYYFSDIDQVMMYAFTYVQVEQDVTVDLCVSSDDSVQVLIDGIEAWCISVPRGVGNANVCTDSVAYGKLTAGEHTVMVKVFEGAGGHAFRFGFMESGTTDPAPGITVCLRPEQDTCVFPPIPIGATITWDVTREVLAQGVSYTLDVDAVRLTFQGDVEGLRTLGETRLALCMATDQDGYLVGSQFLALGPFAHAYACGADQHDLLLGNTIANANIRTQYPNAGETIDYSPVFSTTKAYYGPLGTDGMPVWRRFNDSTEDGHQDIDAGISSRDAIMGWLVTYIENIGPSVDITICFGTDDGGQLWWDCDLLANTRACQGLVACNAGAGGLPIPVTVTTGVHRIAAAAFENAGESAISIRLLQSDGITPILDGDPNLKFRGRQRPAGFTPPACEPCGPGGGVHLTKLTITPPLGGGTGSYRMTATANDDTGNAVVCTFTATKAGEAPIIAVKTGTIAATNIITNIFSITSAGTWTFAAKVGGPTNCATDTELSETLFVCPKTGDAHCQGLQVVGPFGGGAGTYQATCTAVDDGGHPLIYTFQAKRGEEAPIVVGPQAEATASFDLGLGIWTVSVEVDDFADCTAAADDAVCSKVVDVGGGGPARFRRGDADGSGKLDLTDAIATLQFLYMGYTAPACKDAADTDDSGTLDLTDAIASLQFQFMGGTAPANPGPVDCGPDPTDGDQYIECTYTKC